MKRTLPIVLVVAASAAAGLGLAIGGWDFLEQHWAPLGFASLALTMFATLGVKILAGIVRGAVLAVRKPKELGQSGAAAAEFVIVVIPFMLMLTGLMQLALASMGRVLVSYAAFCAARAAIVIVPMAPAEVQGMGAKLDQAFTDELRNKVGYGANTRTDFAISKNCLLYTSDAADE